MKKKKNRKLMSIMLVMVLAISLFGGIAPAKESRAATVVEYGISKNVDSKFNKLEKVYDDNFFYIGFSLPGWSEYFPVGTYSMVFTKANYNTYANDTSRTDLATCKCSPISDPSMKAFHYQTNKLLSAGTYVCVLVMPGMGFIKFAFQVKHAGGSGGSGSGGSGGGSGSTGMPKYSVQVKMVNYNTTGISYDQMVTETLYTGNPVSVGWKCVDGKAFPKGTFMLIFSEQDYADIYYNSGRNFNANKGRAMFTGSASPRALYTIKWSKDSGLSQGTYRAVLEIPYFNTRTNRKEYTFYTKKFSVYNYG